MKDFLLTTYMNTNAPIIRIHLFIHEIKFRLYLYFEINKLPSCIFLFTLMTGMIEENNMLFYIKDSHCTI